MTGSLSDYSLGILFRLGEQSNMLQIDEIFNAQKIYFPLIKYSNG